MKTFYLKLGIICLIFCFGTHQLFAGCSSCGNSRCKGCSNVNNSPCPVEIFPISCTDCDHYPCICNPKTVRPCTPCAPLCGSSCGLTCLSMGLAIALIIGVAAVILSESAHTHDDDS